MENTNQNLKEIVEEKLTKVDKTISMGQHLIVNEAEDSSFVVKDDAKLTIKKSKNNKIFYQAHGELVLANQENTLIQEV